MVSPTHKFRKGPRSLAEFTHSALSPAAARLGFGEADIILHWPDIAGERLAQVSEPERLQWPVRGTKSDASAGAEPASLILRVEGAFAIEIQHLAPLLIQRINTRLGWRCVSRIQLRQGPVRRRAAGRGKVPPPSPQLLASAEKLTEGIETEDLRKALTRLGARVLDAQALEQATPTEAEGPDKTGQHQSTRIPGGEHTGK